MGNAEESLEWARVALTSSPMQSRVQSLGIQLLGNLCMSAALAHLGRIKEAKTYLDIGNELALKAGIEVWLSDVSFCRGLIARAEGKLNEAIEYFLHTFEVLERLQRQGRLNECLFVLAETEIQNYVESPDANATLALHWIDVMEEMARKKDLPGVLGLVLILKSRLQTIRGQNETAHATLREVRELSANPSSLFLQDRIEIEYSAINPKRRK
jgi:ATP/maltotriose-dependent transcriptional regulator MalT